jgi:hypothetical protein
MANVTIYVQVTPPADSSSNYQWAYQIGSDTGTYDPMSFVSQFAEVAIGSNDQITLNLVPNGVSTDTCVFQSSPLTFFQTYQATGPGFIPEWYTPPAGGTSSITFMDGNPNKYDRTYYFQINAAYNQENIPPSPDPTIVNVGTDGTRPPCLPSRHDLTQPQQGTAESAV